MPLPPLETPAPPEGATPASALLPELTDIWVSDSFLPHLLATVCERTARLFRAERASVFLIEEGSLVPRMARRIDGTTDPAAWARFLAAPSLPTLVSAALADEKPHVARRFGVEPGDTWWAESFGVGSALAVPLGSPGRVLGVLALDDPEPGTFNMEMAEQLMEATSQLGPVVAAGLRVERQQAELAAARAVRDLMEESAGAASAMEAATAVARVVNRALGTERCMVMYFPGLDGSQIEVATVELPPQLDAAVRRAVVSVDPDSSYGWRRATSTLRPYLVDQVNEAEVRPSGLLRTLGLRSYASLPLLAGKELVGRVVCGYASRQRRWREADRMMATQLALEGALLMDGALLREADAAHRARLAHQASHDPLTDLPNRSAVRNRLVAALDRARDRVVPLTVVVVDLDRFKEVNDALGHHRCDELLAQVARRLERAVGQDGLVGRLGGDEFAVVLEPGQGGAEAEILAARVVAALEEPFDLEGSIIKVAASIGLASYPEHGDDPDKLLQRADAAMYAAKQAGLAWLVYRPGASWAASRRTELAGGLAGAISGNELVLHYQPQVDLRTGFPVALEALVRWDHPRLGLLGPAEILPIASMTGQVSAVTSWVLHRALSQAASWKEQGMALPVAVNVSARDLADPGFHNRVVEALREAGLGGESLCLELTEHSQLVQPGLAASTFGALRRLGVRASLDDFGTGHACLAYLHALPVDEVKLDRSMVGPELSRDQEAIVRSVITLGADLGLAVVAEGVESEGIACRLADLGCRIAQGFHFSPPLPPGEAKDWVCRRLKLLSAQAS
jgi:diguanylate cyclase (GGDEF)-like protein